MPGVVLLLIGLLGAGPLTEYARLLDAKNLDQAAFDAETYGEKPALKREDDGLRITLKPGAAETGWKTPQVLKIGGNFTISATFVIKTLPKPAQEDGAAVGLAIAFQDINQPDLTVVRVREPNGSEVYRSIEKAGNNPNMNMPQPQPMMMRMQQPGAKPPKPPRPTFPASGDTVRIELQRKGNILRYQVVDGTTGRARYLGQGSPGANDVAAIKLFATNRNGAEPINVLLRDLTIHADHVNGLGTSVRTVFDTVVYGEPTAIEAGALIVGGPPKAPPPAPTPKPNPKPQEPAAATGPKPSDGPISTEAFAPLPTPKEKPKDQDQEKAATKTAKAEPKKAQEPPKPKEKARIPLDEVEIVRFERSPTLAGRFLGQPNFDFTMPGLSAKKDEPATKDKDKDKDQGKAKEQAKEKEKAKTKDKDKEKEKAKKAEAEDDPLAPPPGTAAAAAKIPKVEPKKNGIRDLNLSLANLRDAEINQVTVSCQTDKGPASWRLDTSDSEDWPLVLRRSGTEPWADLFFEPPAGDCFQKDFSVNITYKDGQNANVNIKGGDVHTDPKLAIDPKGPGEPLTDVRVYLTGDESLFGRLEAIGEENVRLMTPWLDRLEIPLSRVVGLHFALLGRKESRPSFEKRLKARGSEDLLLAQTKAADVVAIAGIAEGTEADRFRFRYKDTSRTLPLKQVEGLVMASRPDPREPDEPRASFALPGGLSISGPWKDLDTIVWTVETTWGQTLKLPATDVQGVRFHGGKMTYLSDLTPSKVEETPFFGRKIPWRRDVGLAGEPLKIHGVGYDRGLAVHSRSDLTFDLNGRFSRFEALVGFDDAANGKGRVVCRVFADGKELYANPDLRADGPPVKLDFPVAGAEQLRLLVDYGQGEDTGDRLIWANARLYREVPRKKP